MKACKYCGKEFKAVWLHERNCQLSPKNLIIKDRTIPKVLMPDPAFKPDNTMTEPEKFKAFMENAPIWSQFKPGRMARILAAWQGKPFKTFVFVDDDKPSRVLYLPYESDKGRIIIPGYGYYFMSIAGDPTFIHAKYMVPLVNSPDIKSRFMLPAHVVMFAHAQGLAEGKMEGFDDLIKAINRYQLLMWAAAIVALIALIVTGYVTYQSSSNEAHLVQLMTNMTQQNSRVILGR